MEHYAGDATVMHIIAWYHGRSINSCLFEHMPVSAQHHTVSMNLLQHMRHAAEQYAGDALVMHTIAIPQCLSEPHHISQCSALHC